MDRNTLLAITLSMGVFTLWLMWQAQNAPPRELIPESSSIAADAQPGQVGGQSPSARDAIERAPALQRSAAAVVPGGEPAALVPQQEEWTRVFDRGVYQVEVTNRGAGLTGWVLTEELYSEYIEGGSRPLQLLQLDENRVALTTPFTELGLGNLANELYRVESSGPDGVSFVLERGGVQIRKRYRFAPSGYDFELDVEVRNDSQRVLRPEFQIVWPAMQNSGNDFETQSLAALHPDGVERELLSSVGVKGFFGSAFGGRGDGPFEFIGDIEWAGIDNTYFIGVLAPERTRSAQVLFEGIVNSKIGATILSFDPLDLPSGQSLEHRLRGYIGPKQGDHLAAFGAQLDRSVDRGYDWLAPLTSFFQWMLTVFYSLVGNYGWAIVIITVLVRVVTSPIMMRQMKSQERMREVQPQLKELQEKYKDDRAKQSEAMMALYKKEGVNPLGGCLPMLLQFPVFIGLFFALKSSIELRHAPFMLWMDDLSSPESLFMIPGIELPVRVLPIVMGASMVLQQRLTPMTMDPAQARMMMTVMPIMMTVLFYQFPSGLVLYWMISNFLGIGHQMWVGKRMRAAAAGGAVGASVAKDPAIEASAGGSSGEKPAGNRNRKRAKKKSGK